jgi:3-hydroxyisobutyrate dehydrogenase-like beta-hydroxyacid dehydrogenase
MRVAFLGTGIMGFPMARKIAAAGLEVRAWKRTRERAQPLAESGIEIADDPSAAASGADFVDAPVLGKRAPAEQGALVVGGEAKGR